jgi:hypothetical protein
MLSFIAARKFAREKIFLRIFVLGVETDCSLKRMSFGSFIIAVKRQGTR